MPSRNFNPEQVLKAHFGLTESRPVVLFFKETKRVTLAKNQWWEVKLSFLVKQMRDFGQLGASQKY
jgi:hypothetical protein